jgi:hypothetical protein
MRKNIFLFLLLSIVISCNYIANDGINLIPVKNGNLFQYIDKDGKILINPQFTQASVFRNGLALVQTSTDNPQWGYIGEDGKYIITPMFKYATIFSEDLAWGVLEGSAPAAINNKGEILFKLESALTVNIFKDGLAAYSEVSEDGKILWGFVGKEGLVKINPQFSLTGNFSNGKCAVRNEQGKWGYINKEGKIIINYQFDDAREFVNGRAPVSSGDKMGVIDENGKYIINPQFKDLSIDGDLLLINQGGKYGWADNDGKIFINPQFNNAFPFNRNEYAAIQSGDKWGYIDKEGKIAINPQFEFALPFTGSLAMVASGEKIGFIDNDGKFFINPQFDDVSEDLIYYYSFGNTCYGSINTDFCEPPLSVARKFMTAIEDKKYDEAALYATDDTKAVIELIKGGKGNETKREFVWGEEKIDKDIATVKYKVKGSDRDEDVMLIKKDNKWLVTMTKSQMTGKTGLEGLDINSSSGVDEGGYYEND